MFRFDSQRCHRLRQPHIQRYQARRKHHVPLHGRLLHVRKPEEEGGALGAQRFSSGRCFNIDARTIKRDRPVAAVPSRTNVIQNSRRFTGKGIEEEFTRCVRADEDDEKRNRIKALTVATPVPSLEFFLLKLVTFFLSKNTLLFIRREFGRAGASPGGFE